MPVPSDWINQSLSDAVWTLVRWSVAQVILTCSPIWAQILERQNHQEGFVNILAPTQSFWFIGLGVESENSYFWQVPRWGWCCRSRPHSLRAAVLEPQAVSGLFWGFPAHMADVICLERCSWLSSPICCEWTVIWLNWSCFCVLLEPLLIALTTGQCTRHGTSVSPSVPHLQSAMVLPISCVLWTCVRTPVRGRTDVWFKRNFCRCHQVHNSY